MMYLEYEVAAKSAGEAGVIILPVPFEQTTCYGKGTKEGPRAIIESSPHLEFYDEYLDSEPWKIGIYTESAIDCDRAREEVFQDITAAVEAIVRQEKLVISLGGEHSVSLPAYMGVHDQFKNISVVQLDAHSDLRNIYEGSEYSHACVMRRIWEHNKDINGIGIRSQCKEERDFIVKNNINILYAHDIKKRGWNVNHWDSLAENVYLTIDVDFFDPSVIPATGTPVPGGFLWNETLDLIESLFIARNVVAVDIVELSPNKNLVFADFTIASLIYKIIGFYCAVRKGLNEKG